MNILFITPPFYGYYRHIYNILCKEGHNVDLFNNPSSFLFKLVTTIWGLYCKPANYIRKKHFNHVKKLLGPSYDCILVIRGSEVPDFFYDFLKVKYPLARFVQYLWDDVSLDTRSLDTIKYFDKVLSFNPDDCKEYGFIFRPFFYNENISLDTLNKTIDIMMIGSYKYNRFLFAKKLLKFCHNNELTSLVILRASVFLFLTRLEHLRFKRLFRSSPVSYSDMLKLLAESRACVEICEEGQNGLSTRQFEAMHARTKVVTTNKNVKQYDFYNPSNIYVLDDGIEKNERVVEWLKSPYEDIPEALLEKYSLKGFVKDLLA